MVKLIDKNIKWIISHAEILKDETTKSISRMMYNISERRVQQLRCRVHQHFFDLSLLSVLMSLSLIVFVPVLSI